VSVGSFESGYRRLCLRCYNAEVSAADGRVFNHVDFPPLDLTDATGRPHRFEFALRLLGDQLALEAIEGRPDHEGGYRFQVLGAADDDPHQLQARLVARMRRHLARRHLEVDERGDVQLIDGRARGTITWGGADHDGPVLVIDGQAVRWEQFGRMLLTYEGFQFRLELVDPSDEV
jgi:hypothetical protein